MDVTHEDYGGAILFNPGGPGVSTTDFVTRYGQSFSRIFNSRGRRYDLIGWDVRGAGATTPNLGGLDGFATTFEYLQKLSDLSSVLEKEEVYNRFYEAKGIYGKLLVSQQSESDKKPQDHPALYIGTTHVVRDMVEIIEKHGHWRQETAEKIINLRKAERLSDEQITTIRQRCAHHKDHEMLQYWGGSYGTILGQTFASMYPERIQRMVIDGVANITDYYGGKWENMLSGTEAMTATFLSECEAAGPEVCSFASVRASFPNKSLSEIWKELFDDIHTNPMVEVIKGKPVSITRALLQNVLHGGYYSGWFGFKSTSEIMWQLSQRNASYFNLLDGFDVCKASSSTVFEMGLSYVGITCNDGKLRRSRQEYKDWLRRLNKESPSFGNFWAEGSPACQYWPENPTWHYSGPFGGKTASPILVIAQTIDPVTPLTNAQEAVRRWPGSFLVETDGLGHMTFGYPSVCAMKQMKMYFDSGSLDTNFVHCPSSVRPLQTVPEVLSMMEDMEIQDKYLLAAVIKIAHDFPPESIAAVLGGDQSRIPGPEAGEWWGGGTYRDDQGRRNGYSVEQRLLVAAQYV